MATETRKLLDLILDGKQGYWTGKSVISSRGTTFEAHEGNSEIHTPKATIDAERAAAITEAINLLKDGTTDGTGNLSTSYDNLKKIETALEAVKTDLAVFLSGEEDGGTIDRLSELIKAINENKGTIEALTSDKVNKADIVDGLTSTDADKPLSANQGRALKALIDAISETVGTLGNSSHGHDNLEVLNGASKDASGNFVYNGKVLNGETGIAFKASADAESVYTGKLDFVLSSIEVEV